MKIVAGLHMYPPAHGAGAEWMAHEILRYLQRQGAEVQVVLRDNAGTDEFEGVPIANNAIGRLRDFEADIFLTHLDVTRIVMSAGRSSKTPVVHLIHNHMQVRTHQLQPRNAALIVHNSEYVSKYTPPRLGLRSIIVNPHIPTDRYQPSGRRLDKPYTTLMNLFAPKGAATFWELAERHPERPFLGVIGAYGQQDIRSLPNVTLIENTPDVTNQVYAETRVLLVPSKAESWGRVALEAASSGIPVIASTAPGLVESMSGAALFADWDDVDLWESLLLSLDDSGRYERYSLLAEHRALLREEESLEQMANMWEVLQTL